MRAAEFFEYLTERYRSRKTGKPLSERAARDAVSRCRRTEVALGEDLDSALRRDVLDSVLKRIETLEGRFAFGGSSRHGLVQHRGALKLYAAFVTGSVQTAKTRQFYPGRYP